MKKTLSTILLVSVLVLNNFLITSQAKAAAVKNGGVIAAYIFGKGAQIYNHNKKKEERRIKNNNQIYIKWKNWIELSL